MARQQGKLKVSKKLGGTIKRTGAKDLSVPKVYILAPRGRFNNTPCEFELENGAVTKVFVDGKELPKDTAAEEQKQNRIEKRKREEEQEKIRKEEEKKYAKERAKYRTDSFNITEKDVENGVTYFCPSDTKALKIEAFQAENFALKLNRFARFIENENYAKSKFEFYKTNRGKIEHQIKSNYGNTDFTQITQRAKRNATTLFGENCEVFNQSTAGRLITGLGGASVYETDIALHHVYGFPYLPASGIKGVVRSWIIQQVFASDSHVPKEEKEYPLMNAEFRAYHTSEDFCRIFGCPATVRKILFDKNTNEPIRKNGRYDTEDYYVALKNKETNKREEHQGKVQFFDAFPTKAPEVVPDLMNPHYGPYYAGDKPPADYYNPVPIFFLTVDKNTEFQFLLGSKEFNLKKKLWAFELNGEKETLTLCDWLKSALTHHGIGAKTAVGYGYMKPSSQ